MKKLLLIILSFTVLFSSVAALEITISGKDDWIYSDWYKFDTLRNRNIFVLFEDKFSSAYRSWNRVDIYQKYDILNNWNWILESELYWDFYLKDGSLKMKDDINLRPNCDGKVAYSYTWTLYSPSFWNLEIKSWSYYCPLSWSSSLILWSELLWKIVISWNNEIKKVTVKNGKWKEKDVSGSIVFDDKKVSISWLQNLKDLSWLNSDYSEDSSKNINYSVNWKMANLNKSINKNLAKYTKWQAAFNENIPLIQFSKKIHYYDFEWKEWTEINHNKWEILTIW
jgi:hypothetical protein